jgi:ribonuclease Y
MNGLLIGIIALVVGVVIGFGIFRYIITSKYKQMMKKAEADAEVIKKNKLLEVKEKFLNKKADLEKEVAQRNQKIQQIENKLKQKEISLNQRQEEHARKKNENEQFKENLENQQAVLDRKKDELEKLQKQEIEKLELLSVLSAEEAKEHLIESLKEEAKTQASSYINDIMDDAKMTANREAKRIVIQSIQRVATETAIENSVTVFHIDSDEVKGRIIGREGRNIRALEAATGVEIVVDDTPEAIVLSAFDPVRREIARIALEKLIVDGRIHPARIEETVEKAKKEVEQQIREEGDAAALEVGVQGIHPELLRLLGKMKFRTSYGQNVLKHSIEVAQLSGLLAAELGLDVRVAKRAGLLHDIGKAVDREQEGTHVQLGADLCRKYKESQTVINAVEAHHGDVEPETLIACIVQAADTISAARPGARREAMETYTNRLKELEEISNSFKGVEKSFAIQAGREIRIMVVPEQVSDADMVIMARDISKQIESQLEYPGQIKVNVIRESRVTDYAK